MHAFAARSLRVEQDPAVLAFLKCHVTSFLRWDVLRQLVSYGDRWTDSLEIAQQLHKPPLAVAHTLHELADEGLLSVHEGTFGSRIYRLDPQEPSAQVAERLVLAAPHSHELRQMIVARIVGGNRRAS